MSKAGIEKKLNSGEIGTLDIESKLEPIINDLDRYRLLFETGQNALMFMTMDGRIFEPFYSTRDIGSGVGLGLSISYDIIVNKHKGELTADSIPGVGTTFVIRLPIQ